ncbi:protein phosphatase 1F [Callorhinchus milii]|uniref:Protein phosphatase 1E n=1 Tax=Callorhinchus milii TaxID=7868 RepID=V9KL12_CALMI|nr:protein phosphatase 1F [Callorhinchus milii]
MAAPPTKSETVAPEEHEVRRVLGSILKEFKGALGPEDPLPEPCRRSAGLSREEVEGECIQAGLKLLLERNVPPVLAAALIQATIAQVLQFDLSVFRRKGESQHDEEAIVLLQQEPLARLFFNKCFEVCCEWKKRPPLLYTPKRYLKISVHAIRGGRRKMEDRHVVLSEFDPLFGITDKEERAYFAVFDGHCGVDAAGYAATHLHVKLARQELLLAQPAEALRKAFKQTDEMFLQRAKRERLRSGTTGVSALVVGDSLHVAWLGDSQVMMVRKGEVMTLMDPHKPEREDEKQRIKELGGCVAFLDCWRVNGTLAVSRAIGDIDQKPYISGDADSASFTLDGTEDYIVLGCDGFFDTVEPSKVVDLVREHLQESAGDGSEIAKKLVEAAKENGSRDNITVILVFLREPVAIWRDSDCHRGHEKADHLSGLFQAGL